MTAARANPTLPRGWRSTELGEVAELRRGLSWAKAQERAAPGNGSVPVLRIPNVQEHLDLDDILYLDGVTAKDIEQCGATAGWSLMVASNGNPDRVGNCVLIDRDTEFVFASFLVAVGTKDRARLSPKFLYRLLRSHTVQRAVTRNVQGSTGLSNINLHLLLRQPVPLPPSAEQAKIAAVLGAVDEAVERSRAVIAQTRTLRQALLHTLLTRGLPGRHRAFRHYAPVGTIPADWTEATLEGVCEKITDGVHASVKTVDSGIPFLYVSCVRDGAILWDNAAAITDDTFATISKGRRPEARAVLFTLVGSFGHAAVVPDARPFSFQRHIGYLIPKHSTLNADYLSLWLNSPAGRKQATRLALGNAQKTITLGDLADFPLPLPPIEEQDAIVRALNTSHLAAAEAHLAQLERAKSVLSAALLTGKTRTVRNPLPEAP